MAFDPNADIKDATIRGLFTQANAKAAPVDRAKVSAAAQDCAVALAQVQVGYSGQGVTVKGAVVYLFGAKLSDPKLLAAAINVAAFDDAELVALSAGLLAALQAAAGG